MDKPIRNAIERATQEMRHLLEDEFEEQLEGTYDILPDGSIAATGGGAPDRRAAGHPRDASSPRSSASGPPA